MTDESWRLKAKCLGMPPALFIRDDRGGSNASVLAICNGTKDGRVCPVRKQCGEFGARHNLIGVWGGEYRSVKSSELPVLEDLLDARPKKS